MVDYGFLLRDGDGVDSVHDRHVEGLFARGVWLEVLARAGYEASTFERPLGDGRCDEIFLASRPVRGNPASRRGRVLPR